MPALRDLPSLAAATPAGVRAVVAERWLGMAQAEHASIGSFGRFALQLIAVGAPARLLEASHRAALDEITHTRICFSIASTYAGTMLGPGPLPIAASEPLDYDLRAIICGTIEEGCVGETIGALEARTARDAAGHPELRDALDRIHRDESVHAQLAFETVGWGLAQRPDLVAAARATFEKTLAAHRRRPEPERTGDPDLTTHGLLSEQQRHEVRLRVTAEILGPAVETLLASTRVEP